MSLIHYDRQKISREADWTKGWSSPTVTLPSYEIGVEAGRVGKLLGQLSRSEEATNAILDAPQQSLGISGLCSGGTFVAPSRAAEFLRLVHKEPTVESKLYDSLASFKVRTAQIAMHLENGFRQRLFRQLDSLLGKEDWIEEDEPPALASFSTFLRLILFLRPAIQPGLGATQDGHLIAMWTSRMGRLSIECLPNDQLRWVLSRHYGENLETAAGRCELSRIRSVLEPYDPQEWFSNADSLLTPSRQLD